MTGEGSCREDGNLFKTWLTCVGQRWHCGDVSRAVGAPHPAALRVLPSGDTFAVLRARVLDLAADFLARTSVMKPLLQNLSSEMSSLHVLEQGIQCVRSEGGRGRVRGEPAPRPPCTSAPLPAPLWARAHAHLWEPLGFHTAPEWPRLHSPEPSGPEGTAGAWQWFGIRLATAFPPSSSSAMSCV